MSDLNLWRRLKKGEEEALKECYDMCVSNLFNYAKKFTNDNELIEDAIHDLFVLIWQKRENLTDTDSIIKYLCVSLRRELIRRINKAHDTMSFETKENKEFDFALTIEDLIIREETDAEHSDKLKFALSSISHRQKEAIYLKYYEEMSYEQICEIMDINYQSVRNLISKGIIEMRKFISILCICISIML